MGKRYAGVFGPSIARATFGSLQCDWHTGGAGTAAVGRLAILFKLFQKQSFALQQPVETIVIEWC